MPARSRATGPTSRPTSVAGVSRAWDCRARALAIWPRIDIGKLRRTNGDPERVARLIEHRTVLSRREIVALLHGSQDEN